MAKAQARTSLTAADFSVGQGNYEDAAQAVAEELNADAFWSLAVQGASLVTADDGWGSSGNELETHYVTFPASSGYTRRYRYRMAIDPDATEIALRSVVTMPAANTGRVRFTVGATNSVHNHTAGATTTVTSTLAVSATGSGDVSVEIEVDHQTGSSTSCFLERFGVRQSARTSGLPDPTG
jgi:hypothetical protein